MVIRNKVKIPTLSGENERTSYIYLPVGYERGDRRYPVLYMFDGHNLFSDEEATFGKSWGLSDYLDYTDTPIIVAAVECSHKGNSRLSEYSPVSFDYHGERVIGRGKKYMDWLTSDFKGWVDSSFRTLPDREHTFIAGSSMGGLMTIYAIAKYGNYFSRGAALSPSLWVQEGQVPTFISKAKFRQGTRLYTDYGSKEFSNHSPQRELFGEVFKILCSKGVAVTARIVPGGTHCEATWQKEIPYFMDILLED